MATLPISQCKLRKASFTPQTSPRPSRLRNEEAILNQWSKLCKPGLPFYRSPTSETAGKKLLHFWKHECIIIYSINHPEVKKQKHVNVKRRWGWKSCTHGHPPRRLEGSPGSPSTAENPGARWSQVSIDPDILCQLRQMPFKVSHIPTCSLPLCFYF